MVSFLISFIYSGNLPLQKPVSKPKVPKCNTSKQVQGQKVARPEKMDALLMYRRDKLQTSTFFLLSLFAETKVLIGAELLGLEVFPIVQFLDIPKEWGNFNHVDEMR